MIQPSHNRFEDDPEELELPPFGTRALDDETWQPDDDSDLDIAHDDDDRGLDADLGFGEDDGDTSDDEREEESWLEPGDLRAGLVGDDDGADDELDENSWTEGSEPPTPSADEFAEDFGLEEHTPAEDDRGLEGFGDDAALPDIDLEKLPPLDGSQTPDDDGPDALGDERIADLAASPDGRGTELDAPAARRAS